MFKVQTGCKDIVKIIHVTSVVHPSVYEAARIFLCVKKTKIMTLFNNFLSSTSDFDVRSRWYHDACMYISLLASKEFILVVANS